MTIFSLLLQIINNLKVKRCKTVCVVTACINFASIFYESKYFLSKF